MECSQGMGIPVGKLSLYTALGGVRPSSVSISINNATLSRHGCVEVNVTFLFSLICDISLPAEFSVLILFLRGRKKHGLHNLLP